MAGPSLVAGRRWLLAVAATLLAGCTSIQPTPDPARYIVTSAPLDTGVTQPPLCLALDLSREPAVWWWQPGRSGCSSRSTGPDLFRAGNVRVAAPPSSGPREIRFELQLLDLHSPSGARMVDVVLALEEGLVRAQASGARVPTHRRSDLNIPSE